MRRFWFIFLIFSASNFFSQITKSDFEAIFLEFPFEKIETIVVNNVRYHNDDGTSKLTYFTYKTSAARYEIKNNSFYIIYYPDSKKNKAAGYYIIPFDKMSSVGVRDDILIIYLIE